MQITEIYHSIQGESTYVGLPCVFIRLTGCSLRCSWCDTTYAFHGGTKMPIDHICEQVRSYGTTLVEITGGEPLDQPEVIPLVARLCDEGYEVLIETSGAIDITPLDTRSHVIMDVKCPASGMIKYMYWENLSVIKLKDEVKFVITDRRDYDWAVSVIEEYQLDGRCPILFSPVFGVLEPHILSDWVLQDRLKVRVQLQLHKYIWDPQTQGV
ncbi:MAG TPA: radical SAM protein [Nitrospirales bacterium]|nr:radical SAM protein [Nitrospirales bacterium]HIN32442.1 radical SAM protein [Nitrospirales bacterium]HIO69522.1 radical SAM protein [Nitrospirales bacterium]